MKVLVVLNLLSLRDPNGSVREGRSVKMRGVRNYYYHNQAHFELVVE